MRRQPYANHRTPFNKLLNEQLIVESPVLVFQRTHRLRHTNPITTRCIIQTDLLNKNGFKWIYNKILILSGVFHLFQPIYVPFSYCDASICPEVSRMI